ncbi:hypothetical protein EDD21DRAFT_421415 [Dissophora ornata]|nr:hypothetical protein BGZ58_008272 [Dissophora ornata]KAI8594697.1 hypothetical protein EDD21DRAFT_421415 [Dissophora ornata]
MLVDHSRDLSISLKKLTRRDQNPEHTLAEWDSALRQPFEHLTSYDEWLQRVDPQSKFCKEYRTQLDGVIHKVKMVADANQQPRNMLRRLSTMARGVIKRKSSTQLLNNGSPSAPQPPTTPTTPLSSTESTEADGFSTTPVTTTITKEERSGFTVANSPPVCLPLQETVVEDLAISDNDMLIDAVMEPVLSASFNIEQEQHQEDRSVMPDLTAANCAKDTELKEPSTPIADTFLVAPELVPSSSRHLQHHPSTFSELSSAGTLAVATSSSLVSSSASSVHSKSSSSAETLHGRPIQPSSSLARQTFLAEKESRKATLRIGTSGAIQAKAESLQSPTFSSNPSSIDNLRKASPIKNEKDTKPPVKSLINFWEQVSDPLDA